MIREPSVKKIAGVPVTPIFLPKAIFLSNGLVQSVFPVGATALFIQSDHALDLSAEHQIFFDEVCESAESIGIKNV